MRRRCYLLLLLIAAIVSTPVAAFAQAIPSLAPSEPASSGVPGIRTQGLFVTAPVGIDGTPVVRIAALANPPAGSESIQTRLWLVRNAIGRVLAADSQLGSTAYDPATLRVSIEQTGSDVTLVVRDAHHQTPAPIVTVSLEDAQLAGVTESVLAAQWQQAFQSALVAALEKRQPSTIAASTNVAIRGALALLALTILAVVGSLLARKRARAVAEVSLFALALVWVAAITAALLLFPQTVVLGQEILRAAGRVALIWLGAFAIDRALDLLVDRLTRVFARRSLNSVDRARRLLRAPTISRAINGFKSVLILFVAALGTLTALSIPVASVVTIGGIAALAIGFAAQSLVRDCLNGMLVLMEDQYVVGDYVMIGSYNGIVEALTVRVVQIRDGLGNLITIPHSAVTQVANASRAWARVDYRVAIDAGSDVPAALRMLGEVLESLAKDPAWSTSIIEPVETIGVETLSKLGVVLRIVVRTAPLRQFELRRAINARVLERFAAAGIALGIDPLLPVQPVAMTSPDPS
ncbi:MAG TPA: mechanosensitive ion channel family protein [Candidatus Baltobacteraceae bacterium]|nr:mechanosensitive ion channel family protein [Candidatus Baltobacteraceae bacterium]